MTIQRTFNRTLETTFIGLISGEREVPVSSTPDWIASPADHAVHDAVVDTYNAVIDLFIEHNKNTRGLGRMYHFEHEIDSVDIEDEEEFVEWKGEFLFPASGRIECSYYFKKNDIDSLFSSLPTELIVDGDALSIEWVKE